MPGPERKWAEKKLELEEAHLAGLVEAKEQFEEEQVNVNPLCACSRSRCIFAEQAPLLKVMLEAAIKDVEVLEAERQRVEALSEGPEKAL